MSASATIHAGICGLVTAVRATSEDQQNVTFDIQSGCHNIKQLAAILREHGPVDAFAEVGGQSVILTAGRKVCGGCCAGCIVPNGVFKAAQIAAGLALPKACEILLESQE